MKPISLLVAFSCFAIGFFVVKNLAKPDTEVPKSEPVIHVSDSVQAYSADANPVDGKAYQLELDRKRARLSAESFLGLKALALKSEKGLLKVPLSFMPRKVWCQGGDLDTLKIEALGSNQILMTLEPLSSGKGDFMRTDFSSLSNSIDGLFRVEAGEEAKLYGLYICSDRKKETSCKKKALKSHAQINEDGAAASKNEEDFIFFFQPLVIEKNRLESYRMNDFSKEFKGALENYVKTWKGPTVAADFAEAWKVSNLVRSLPLNQKGEHLLLDLPYSDSRCLSPATANP